jgi:uncharacterized protein
MDIIISCVLGLLTGFISGMFGIGGGVGLVPLLVYVLKYTMHTAVGTSLVIIIPTALAGAMMQGYAGNINFRGVWFVALCAVIGSIIGVAVMKHVNDAALRRLFAVLLMALAIHLFFK